METTRTVIALFAALFLSACAARNGSDETRGSPRPEAVSKFADESRAADEKREEQAREAEEIRRFGAIP